MILVTGGAGYIGSHTVVELLATGAELLVIDNFSNSKAAVLERIERISGRHPAFHPIDIRDRAGLERVFRDYAIDAVIHFAGLKAVGESVSQPLRYYDNNVCGSVVLFETMAAHGVKRLVFSSSATVYGDPPTVPIREDFPLHATSPYGRCKLMVEEILRDLAVADPEWRIALLRYFNPVGAHASGLIGEDPSGIPNNLSPFIAQVAIGKHERLSVFGDDYPTPDGTGVRDYIHVIDLARGHLAALRYLERTPGVLIANLGTGQGYSVLELIQTFRDVSGRPIPYEIVGRRPGDITICYADPALAYERLGWKAEKGLREMCEDSWRWQVMNPNGFAP